MRRRSFVLINALFTGIGLGQATYSYDSAGHLTSIAYGSGGAITYGYDAAGNLISRTVATPSSSVITSVITASGGADIAQNTFIAIKGTNLVPGTTPAAG